MASQLSIDSATLDRSDPHPPPDGIVLLYDPNPQAIHPLIEQLRQHGFDVRLASQPAMVLAAVSAGEAVALLIVSPHDDSSTYRLFELLSAAHFLHMLPVIVAADSAGITSARRYLALGADALCPRSDAALVAATLGGLLAKQRRRNQDREELAMRFNDAQSWLAMALDQVIPIGAAATHEVDFNRLLERVVLEAMSVANADGGTLYLRNQAEQLEFAIVRTRSLNLAGGGTTGVAITLPPIPLFDAQTGRPNRNSVATNAVHAARSANIKDVYLAEDHDFSGARAFDARAGYRTQSLLTVPLKDSTGHVAGVLQLVNALSADTPPAVIPFSAGIQRVVEGLATLAAAVLVSYIREQKLRRQVNELSIEVDEARRNRQVDEISTTDYFRQLQERAAEFRSRAQSP